MNQSPQLGLSSPELAVSSLPDTKDGILQCPPRRQLHVEMQKRDVIRDSGVHGLEHLNWRGNIVPKRQTGPDCRCPRKCFNLFSDAEKLRIIDKINSFNTKDEQDIFLQNLIVRVEKTKLRPRKEEPKTRTCNFQYFTVSNIGQQIRVCRKSFASLHGITDKRIRRLCTLLIHGEVPKDKRGYNVKGNMIPFSVSRKIYDHIKSFPTRKTRYCGKEITYLNAQLDVKTMHRLFQAKHPDLGVKYEFYLRFFRENFALRFGLPPVGIKTKAGGSLRVKSCN